MILIALGLSWQLRRAHRQIATVVSERIDRGKALGDLTPILGVLESEWSAAAEEATFRPSVDSMARVQRAAQQRFASGRLPPALRHEVMTIASRAADAASAWDTTPPQARIENAGRIARAVQRMRRATDEERIRNERMLEAALADLRRRSDQTGLVTLAIVYLVGIASLVVAQRALARVIVPIERLSIAVDAVARGETDTRIPVAGDREIAHLGERFNEMTAALAASRTRLEELAHVDELTELPNFRTFRTRFDEELERATRYETPFGLLVLDLDRFKKYNDSYGHQAGNEALRSVAATLRSSVRSVDFPARFGGEEFAVIVPETDSVNLAKLADRIRRAVAAIPAVEGRKSLTVSIGGALFPADGANAEELFVAADRRLYAAKGAGRNRCVVEDVA